MAENQEDRSREDLTEEASPYRIEEYRRRGMVAQSKEVSGLLALIAVVATSYMVAPMMGLRVAELMREVFRTDLSSRMDLGGNHVLAALMLKALKVMISIGLPVCLAGFALGVLGSVAQIGGIFSVEPVTPDLTKIDPIKGLKRLFSPGQLIDGLRVTFKMIVVVAVAYTIVKTQVLRASGHLLEEPGAILLAFGSSARGLLGSMMGVLALFAVADFFVHRWEFSKNLRMTKQEAKQEFKEREGDPQVKARIRSVQREMARKRMMQAVKTADVVVTNPTHIAVALVYQKDKMNAPKVVAKGADFIAQKIKAIASEAGIPMVENVPLARTLYKTVKIGHSIPRALFQAVAEVLAYVYRLKGKRL